MLIQAYCQQEREKRCTITAKTAESSTSSQDSDESGVEKMDTDDPTPDPSVDGTKTPKVEPNESPIPNDVEMIDTSETVTAIKQEPEDEVTSIETDPLAEGDDEGGGNGGHGGGTGATAGTDDNGGSKDNSNANSGRASVGGDEDSANAIKGDAQRDSQSAESQAIKVESDENCNDSNSENNKENPSESTTSTTNTPTNTDEPIKIEESTADKDDPFSKDINIDPRTYCKLGHFHLLLEDYAKGMNECESMNSDTRKLYQSNNPITFYFQPCLHTKNSSIWRKSTGAIRHFCMALEWCIIIIMRIDGE